MVRGEFHQFRNLHMQSAKHALEPPVGENKNWENLESMHYKKMPRLYDICQNQYCCSQPLPENLFILPLQKYELLHYIYWRTSGEACKVCLNKLGKDSRFQYIDINVRTSVKAYEIVGCLRAWVYARYLFRHRPCTVEILASSRELVHMMHLILDGLNNWSHACNCVSEHVFEDLLLDKDTSMKEKSAALNPRQWDEMQCIQQVEWSLMNTEYFLLVPTC